jgi:hypothetical protein
LVVFHLFAQNLVQIPELLDMWIGVRESGTESFTCPGQT